MENKDYYFKCPTAIYLVENGLEKAGNIIAQEGFKKIFILLGGHSFIKSGYLARLEASLKTANIEYVIKSGVQPNPDIVFVRETLKEIREYKPELILACGGGSVIDTAKSLSCSYYYEGDPLDFNLGKAKPTSNLPLGVILTIAAAGSEMSDSCVISDYSTGFKKGFNSIYNRPTFSILDPELTSNLPLYQTCCGAVDIISHSFERYFCPSSTYELCDLLALGLIRDVVTIMPKLLENPHDLEARKSLMLASSASHNGWTSFGKNVSPFRCHFVEHQMSGKDPSLPHGLGLRFLLAEFMEINKDSLKDKINLFGKIVFDINSNNPDDTIEKLNSFFDSLPLPKDMLEVGFTQKDKDFYLGQLKL